ncbi:MarR family transcriptional regulator [Nocardioides nanhaiensis]|uniref:MarR family transcriptional regulator n=1 Tax=Nocardioides nanhaiensis TaxID=1476871 RepID=A0ABP8W3F3_9ACTN
MAAPLPQLELDRQFCFPLYAAARAVTRQYADLLAAEQLTYPQYLCLLALWEADAPMTVGEVGARLRLDSGTLTPVLKRLEAAGVVARHRDPDDERRVLVQVTEAGWALRERVADVPMRLVERAELAPEDALALRALLDKLLAVLPD